MGVGKRGIGGRRGRRGASAVEMAIILPLFVTLILGCVDFGRFAYNYIAVTNAARAAAATGMMIPPQNWATKVTTAGTNEMSSQPGVTSSNITITASTLSTNEAPYGTWYFKATASYPFQTIVNWSFHGYGIPHSMTLTKSVVMRGIRP